MYIIYFFLTCLIVRISQCVNFYAGFTFKLSELPSDFPLLGYYYNKLYFYYSNTIVDNGNNKLDYTYKHLDDIASGLSVYTDPVYDLNKIPNYIKNKHLFGTLESWCYILTLFIFYPKITDSKYKNENVFPYLFNRCINLNYNLINKKNEFDFIDMLMNTETKVDDVYLFEKFSRMFPKPCYIDKNKMGVCKKENEINDLDLINEFGSSPKCYINDFFRNECISYNDIMKKKLNSFKSLFNQDLNINIFEDKWTYMYLSKRGEIELSMESLSYYLFIKLVNSCQTRFCKEIQNLINSMTIKNLTVKFVVGQYDKTVDDIDKKFKLSFGLSFKVDKFRTNNISDVFDFLITEVDFNKLYEVMLGYDPGFMSQDEVQVEEAFSKEEYDKSLSFKDRYNKYIEEKLTKRNVKTPEEKTKDIGEVFDNKFEFLKMNGQGQHRKVTFAMTLDPKVFKRFTPFDSKYFLKVTHMLDESVYVDNYELKNSFYLLKRESDVFYSPTDMVVEENGIGTVYLRNLKTPYIDIEQPEMHSSPIIYHAYVVLDTSVRDLKEIVIKYTLPFHTRYMNMYKSITPELSKVDKLRLLRNPVSRDYSVSLISQPHLYMLDRYTPFQDVPLDGSYLRYLRFLRNISFANFYSGEYSFYTSDDHFLGGNKWVRLYFTHCNNFNMSVKLCQGYRTGLAISTKVLNTFFCNPIIRELGGDVVESNCYLAFSVPIGNQNEYYFIRNVTFFTLIFSSFISLVMVLRYFHEMFPTKSPFRLPKRRSY